MKESDYAKKILPEWQKEHPDARVFRNNSGMAWQGKSIKELRGDVNSQKKIRIIENPRPVFFGVGAPKKDKKTGRTKQVGGGDHIGWESFRLCDIISKFKPDNIKIDCPGDCDNCPMGKKIAVFLNLEEKSENGKESPDQIRFRKMVQEAGGISIILQEGKDGS